MGTVTHLIPAVLQRQCPVCGHVKMQSEIARARVNMLCPRCGKTRLSQFDPFPRLQPGDKAIRQDKHHEPKDDPQP